VDYEIASSTKPVGYFPHDTGGPISFHPFENQSRGGQKSSKLSKQSSFRERQYCMTRSGVREDYFRYFIVVLNKL